jgi:hypothetical protein
MGLESTTYISGLVNTNPTASDPVSQGDDHLRLIKASILSTFPNITGAVTATHTQLNQVNNAFGPGQTMQNVAASRALGVTYTNSTNRPIMVHVRVTANASVATSLTLTVGAISLSSATIDTATYGVQVSAMVPAGETYSAAGAGGAVTLSQWVEVR